MFAVAVPMFVTSNQSTRRLAGLLPLDQGATSEMMSEAVPPVATVTIRVKLVVASGVLPTAWVVHIDGDAVDGLDGGAERSSSSQIQRRPDDLKEAGVSSSHGQLVAPESIIGDDNVSQFNRRRSAGILRNRSDSIVQRHCSGRLVRSGGRCVNPKLRMVAITAAILAHNVKIAVAIHRETFMSLVSN